MSGFLLFPFILLPFAVQAALRGFRRKMTCCKIKIPDPFAEKVLEKCSVKRFSGTF